MNNHASLNRSFRLVRRADAQMVPVPETARGHGAGRAGVSLAIRVAAATLPMAAWAAPPVANQLPTHGTLAAGQASWQSAGSKLTVNQTSQRAVIDWQTFNLGSQATVMFNQSAGKAGATLNRVLDNNPSQILGRIQAPGQVFISNPNGVIFGSSASVDVGGLVATTMSMGASDFMAGGSTWQRNGATGSVVNEGTLTAAEGGYIALLAPEVRNEGVIVARAGSVALAAGETIRLEFADARLSSLQISAAELKTLVENRHAILAPDGYVMLAARSADSLRSGVVNQAGTIDASSLVSRGGRVLLEGDDITLAAGSRIDASGATGGGTVHIGGEWQGSGTTHQAKKVAMAAGASIDASATTKGDGGEVVLWSQVADDGGSTAVHGHIAADGGAQGGNGGRVETSGHALVVVGATVTAKAAQGAGGRWLLDPTDMTIDAAQAAPIVSALQAGTDVAVQTAATGSDAGNITVASGIGWSGSGSLTLSAAHDINLAAAVAADNASAKLTLEYGQGAVAAGSTATYRVQAPVTLAAGPNFITKLGSDGTPTVHTVITDLGVAGDTSALTVQGMSGNLGGHYVLGASLDISQAAGWNSGAGFLPIGDSSTPFTGTFDGLGNVLTGLTINRPSTSYVGLFGFSDAGASIRNIGLPNVILNGQGQIGAITGKLGTNSTISSSYATGTITTGGMSGGMTGSMAGGAVLSDSYSGVAVNSSGAWVGGLTGDQSGGSIIRSYATGNVHGTGNTGSLVGGRNGTISDSYSTGSVSGSGANVGGFYGYNFGGTMTNSGQIGVSTLQSAATFGAWDLAGTWTIYSGHTAPLLTAFLKPLTVTASGQKTYDGTLAADATTTILSDSGATSHLFGTLTYGGGASASAGSYTGVTVGGLYSDQTGYRITYAPASALVVDRKLLTVAGASAADKVYDGQTSAGITGGTLTGVVGSDNVSLLGTAHFADKNVGSGKAVTASFSLGGSSAGNYDVTQPAGLTADITPATLAVINATASNKVYDGQLTASIGGGTLTGVIGSDVVSLAGGTGSFADKNVGTGKAVTASFGLVGADAGNYTLASATGLSADITPALLSVAGAVASNKVYDGQLATSVGGGTLSGSIGSDVVTLAGGTGSFADKNVGAGKAVTVSFVLGGADAGNYIAAPSTALTADITPALLTMAGLSAANKVYDGQTSAVVSGGSLVGVVSGDQVAMQLNGGSFADANVGIGKAVTVDATLNGADAGNYMLARPEGFADISRLAFVAWVGGASGAWLTAGNWAGGAVPTLNNVANVVIPAGTVVSLEGTNAGNAPTLSSLTGAGGVQLTQASLGTTGAVSLASVSLGSGADLAAGSLSTNSLTQSGGQLTVAGALTVDGAFTQSAGRIRANGAASITQAAGDLTVSHLVANGLTLAAQQGNLSIGNVGSVGDTSLQASGNITQAAGGSITVLGAASILAGGNVMLDQSRNMIVGAIDVQGQDVRLTQGLDDLVLGNVIASGNVALTAATGSIRQLDGTAATVAGTTNAAAPQGAVYLMAAANRFGGAVSATGADIGITQGAKPLVLGEIGASGNFAVVSGGAVLQEGAVRVTGQTSIDAGANSVMLDRQANDFTGAVAVRAGALTLVDGAGGLTLGNVLTSGLTLVNSFGGAILQTQGVFQPSGTQPANFNAWLDGAYAAVNINTNASVMINGDLFGSGGATSVSQGMASALNVLTAPSAAIASAEAAKVRRVSRALAIPSIVPVSGN